MLQVSINGIVSFGAVCTHPASAVAVDPDTVAPTGPCDAAHGPYIALAWSKSDRAISGEFS
jgi:hypothetical protein